MPDEPMDDRLAAQLAQLDAEASEDGVLVAPGDLLHYWMAATQLAEMLGMRDLIEALHEEYPHVDVAWTDANWPEDEDVDAASPWLDKLGDAGKALLKGIAERLTIAGLPNVKLMVYFICHGGPGIVEFDGLRQPRVKRP